VKRGSGRSEGGTEEGRGGVKGGGRLERIQAKD
jgi:hypothetical protein